jgi:hypothetical protein
MFDPKHVVVKDDVHGPFVIVVRDLKNPDDRDYPMVVAPERGFLTKGDALTYLEKFKKGEDPYLGLHFTITQMTTPTSFNIYCSW